MSQIVIIKKDFISNQTSSITGRKLVELYEGDLVEIKENGIYLTRKIDLEYYSKENFLNYIKKENR